MDRPPRWATWAAVAIPFTVLPSTLWRLALGFGVPVGYHGDLARLYAAPGSITLYVIVLGAVSEGFALLAIGLVRSWGEVVPHWVPVLRGRRIPVMVAVIPAIVGSLRSRWSSSPSCRPQAATGPRTTTIRMRRTEWPARS